VIRLPQQEILNPSRTRREGLVTGGECGCAALELQLGTRPRRVHLPQQLKVGPITLRREGCSRGFGIQLAEHTGDRAL
jgi:hypothetical protein